jgi:soluble lytic murein transglycosylase-like protein
VRSLIALLLVWPLGALGGAQIYEPLADSVRQRLSSMVADRAPASMHFREAADAQRWLAEMGQRLERRIPDRQQRLELLRTVQYEATRAGLDPQLVLGVIEVESAFRKYAVSRAGARGYMQVMPFWVKLIGQPTHNLFHLRTNIAYGCAILRHYLDLEKGDYYRALGRYNGSIGKSEYPHLVLAAWRGRWKYEGPTAMNDRRLDTRPT